MNQRREGGAAIEAQPAATRVGIAAHELDAAPLGILPHGLALVFSRVLRVLRRQPDVLGRADQGAARLLAVMAQAAPFSQLSRPSASGSRPGGCAFATHER